MTLGSLRLSRRGVLWALLVGLVVEIAAAAEQVALELALG